MTKKHLNIDSLVLIFSIIIFAQVLTYIIPQGVYERVPYPENPSRSMVVDGSYTALQADDEISMQPWYFLLAIPKGLENAQEIIFLVFIVGGVIALMRESGAIDALLRSTVRRLGNSPGILIAGCLTLFAFGAYTIGMGEEYVPLIPILVAMCLAMKMDAIVAMAVVWTAYGIGWSCAGTNPFGVIIAQDIANVPLTSGWEFRLVMMFAFLAVAFHHINRYAKRVMQDPSSSLVADVNYGSEYDLPENVPFTGRRGLVLLVFVLGVIGFVVGAATQGWYIRELNAVFLGIGLVTALVSGMSAGDTSRTFIRGAADMTMAALIIGFARTIEVVLVDGQIIDTIIESIASLLRDAGPELSATGMLFVQTICNFFIPSGSGQAFVTMPIMSPLATLTGVPQQTAVMAYQFGDGFTNMMIPTSALVMGALALGKIPYTAWVRFTLPLLGKLFLLAIAFLVFSVHFGDKVGLY